MVLLLIAAALAAEPIQDFVDAVHWSPAVGSTRVVLELREHGVRTAVLDPVGQPGLAALGIGTRIRFDEADQGMIEVLSRVGVPLGCQHPVVGEGDGLAVVDRVPFRNLLSVGDVPLLHSPATTDPGCPPIGARIAIDLSRGQRAWVRWRDGWELVP